MIRLARPSSAAGGDTVCGILYSVLPTADTGTDDSFGETVILCVTESLRHCVIRILKKSYIMKRDIINYLILAGIGVIILISFVFYYKDFDYYVDKMISEENEETKIDYLEKALNAWQESDGISKKAYAYIYLGQYYYQSDKFEDSIRNFEEATKVDPKMIEAYLGRGTAYMRLHKIENALSDFNKVLELDPGNPHALFDKGWAYHKKKKFDKAMEFYTKSLKFSSPELRDTVLRSKGILFLQTNRPEAALDSLQKSFIIGKDAYTVFLSIIAGSELSHDKYIKEKKKLEQINPEDEWERTLIKFHQENITEDTLFVEAKNAPNEKKIRERLCEAYYYAGKDALYKGDKEKAKEYFKLTIKQNIPEFIEHGLAEAELARGQ